MNEITPEAGGERDGALLAHFGEAVAEDLRGLAVLHNQELTADIIAELKDVRFPLNLGFSLRGESGREALNALAQATDALPREPDQRTLDELAAEFSNIYLIHRYKVSPTESPYFDDDTLDRQEPMFQVRSWYEKYGLQAADWRRQPDDHMVLQLQFVGALLDGATDEGVLRDAATFLDEHLLRWLGTFADKVAKNGEQPFYIGLARFTDAYVEELRDVLADVLGEARPDPQVIEDKMRQVTKRKPLPPSEAMAGA